MSAVVMRHMRAVLAMILAFAVAWSLMCIPGFSRPSAAHAGGTLSISGVDFMETEATGWDLLKVDNLDENQILYITVTKDGKPLSYPMQFKASDDSNYAGDYTGTGEKIAQIVAVEMIADPDAESGQTASKLLGDPSNRSKYAISVSTALMQGEPLYEGGIYPIYGKIVDDDGSFELVLLGIRTANDEEAKSLKNIGVSSTYYKHDANADTYAKSYSLSEDGGVEFVDDAFIVTYVENGEDAIEGTINYVDITTGDVVAIETVSGIGEQPKMVSIKKSFTAAGANGTVKYYRAISRLAGRQVPMSVANASYTVNVIEVEGMDKSSYTVLINYVDESGNLLWSDEVDVKGYGYRYTLPNTFSMNKDAQVESSDGVNFYRLDKVIGGKVVDAATGDDAISTQSASGGQDAITVGASEGSGTALNLTKDLVDADFLRDNDGNRVVKAVYQSQDATKAVDFTVVEIDGETGKELGRVKKTVTPDNSFSYVPENKVIDGTTYVPWSGSTDAIEYSWANLDQSIDLMQYVYYVPEGYVLGDAYDITVQYVNIANGNVLRTQTLAVDPEMTDYVDFVGDPSFVQDGNEYVRLAGQDSGIRHAYFSPNRTYTVYYRDVNDVLSANTVITNTQIIETPLPGTGGGITAVPTPIDDAAAGAAGDGPLADAGITPGDGTVLINDDDNPLANLAGQDTATERTIEENENPLASFSSLPGALATAGIVAGALIAVGFVVFLLLRRRRKAQESHGL